MPKNDILKVFQIVLCLSMVAFLSIGCPSNGSSGNNNGDGDDDNSLVVFGVNLNGTWLTACIFDADLGAWVKSESTYSGSSLLIDNYASTESVDCTEPPDFSFTLETKITLLEDKQALLNGAFVTATKTEIEIFSVTGLLNDPDLKQNFDANEVCDENNWPVGVPIEVSGTDCFPDSLVKNLLFANSPTGDPLDDELNNGDLEGPVDAGGHPEELLLNSAIRYMF